MKTSSDQLKSLYDDYVNPEHEAVRKFSISRQTLDPIPLHSLTSFRETTRSSFQDPEVSHESTLYPSLKISSKVLNKNRTTYKKVIAAMNQMEVQSMASTYRSIMEDKSKLDFFRYHCKPMPASNVMCNWLDKAKSGQAFDRQGNNANPFSILSSAQTPAMKASLLALPYHCKECLVYGWRPEGREGATLTTVPGHFDREVYVEERVYMFGGLSRDLYAELSYLSTNQYGNEYAWTLQDRGNPEYKRYGHTADYYEGRLIIVAGAKMYNKDFKRRECLDDVVICDPVAKAWRKVICGGAYFEPRRYHASCIFGTRLIVHGGLNEKGVYLDSMYSLSLLGLSESDAEADSGLRWATLKSDNQGLGTTAYHTCNLVLESDRYNSPKLLTLMSMPEFKSPQPKVALEGIYYFGGRNASGATNDLHILRIGRPKLEWVKPETKGKRPPARYAHSADFIAKKNILIIFGGRNDEEYETTGSFCMNDIWILSIETLEWTEWKKPDTPERGPEPRYAHATAVLEDSVLIFGGLGETNYCDAGLFEISMIKKNTFGRKNKLNPIAGKELRIKRPPMSKKSTLSRFSSSNLGVFSKVIFGTLSKFGYNLN